MSSILTLQDGNQIVRIDEGELVSYQVEGHEFIHQKGAPGWGSSDTEMFPIIGPVNEAAYQVQVSKGSAIQDQHGLLRLLRYDNILAASTKASFKKEYKAGTPVLNKKYPDKSPKKYLMWPFSFSFEKTYELTASGLEIIFTINGEHDMPYMLGYHPAFKLTTAHPIIKSDKANITLAEVLAVGSRALEISDCHKIVLLDQKELTITTEGFKHFMCWTEVPNMVCLEPITFYPYAVKQDQLHKGFDYLNGESKYKVSLSPNM
ncbi:MAG: aldose 1-epimerase [Croceitalea sp.]|nr:aldose 1-epimerase [Croceitalea sp.]